MANDALTQFGYQAGVATDEAIKSAVAPLSARVDAIVRQNAALDAVIAASSRVVSAVPTTSRLVSTAEPTDLRNLCGMDCNTGKLLRGLDYLRQRLADALTTPRGSQCLLRSRGSNLHELVDSPMNQTGLVGWIAEIAEAISHPLAGLPDFELMRVKLASASVAGTLGIELTGEWLGNPVAVAL
jgi:hypothetical protein